MERECYFNAWVNFSVSCVGGIRTDDLTMRGENATISFLVASKLFFLLSLAALHNTQNSHLLHPILSVAETSLRRFESLAVAYLVHIQSNILPLRVAGI